MCYPTLHAFAIFRVVTIKRPDALFIFHTTIIIFQELNRHPSKIVAIRELCDS